MSPSLLFWFGRRVMPLASEVAVEVQQLAHLWLRERRHFKPCLVFVHYEISYSAWGAGPKQDAYYQGLQNTALGEQEIPSSVNKKQINVPSTHCPHQMALRHMQHTAVLGADRTSANRSCKDCQMESIWHYLALPADLHKADKLQELQIWNDTNRQIKHEEVAEVTFLLLLLWAFS